MDYILNIIYYPLAMILKLCYMLLKDYGLAVILFAVIAKVLLFPIGIKSEKSRRQLQKFQPKIQALQQKYKGDTKNPQYNEEVQKLYSEEGYNPMSGCLPTLIQLPLIMGLWNAIRKPLTYIFDLTNGSLESIYNAIREAGGLAGVETFDAVKNNQMGLLNAINEYRTLVDGFLPESYPDHVNMNFLGMNLGDTPSLNPITWTVIIPIISGLTSFLVGYIANRVNRKVDGPNATQGAGTPNMNFMLYTMPIISTIFAFSFQIGVGIYWIVSNLLSIAQSLIIPLVVKDEKPEVKKKEKKLNYTQIEKMEREKKQELQNLKNKNNRK